MLRSALKNILNFFGFVIASPFIVGNWFEEKIFPGSQRYFEFCSQCLALCPGLPGVVFRRCFYFKALKYCSLDSFIGFGTLISHRHAHIESNVYIGNYNVLGTVHIFSGCYLASRVSIPSSGNIHERQPNGKWSPMQHGNLKPVFVGPDVWIGEGALVLADVAQGSLVAAGSVVTKQVPANIIVGGNPAKVIKQLVDC